MNVYGNPQFFQTGLEVLCTVLPGILRDHYAAYKKAFLAEGIDQTQDICVIGDSKIAADFIFFDVMSANGDDDFRVIGQLQKHPQLTVRFEAGEHAGCMVVVKKLPAEFQVQLAVKLRDSFPDAAGLEFQILFVVKSFFLSHIFIILFCLVCFAYENSILQDGTFVLDIKRKKLRKSLEMCRRFHNIRIDLSNSNLYNEKGIREMEIPDLQGG